MTIPEWHDLDAEKAEEEERIMKDVASLWACIAIGAGVLIVLAVIGLAFLIGALS